MTQALTLLSEPTHILLLHKHAMLIVPCMHVSTPLSLAQKGHTALLLAAYGGSVEVMRMLLKEFNSSLDEVDNVSVYFTI